MNAFDRFREAVLSEVGDLARDFLHGNVDQARGMAADFIEMSRAKLERWSRLLAQGAIDEEEFAALVRSQKDLAQLNALAQAGIALSRAQEFRNKMTDVVIGTAINVLV